MDPEHPQPDLDLQRLLDVVGMQMPFGRFKGHALCDLPEGYLVWFSRQGFPRGRLGEAMQLALEIKSNNLGYLLEPLRARARR